MANNESNSKREPIQVYISVFPEVADAVDADLVRTRHKRVQYISQVMTWFIGQSEEVRDAILSGNASRADAALAKSLKAGEIQGDAYTFDDAANAVKRLLATMQAQHAAHVEELKDAQPNPKKRKG